ncbi:hypothetical protein EYF80_033739 [Liparis tanakae]|uniref:Uncharacterized protein n=1 Tax=Liparis tanakae TaxID=230148 RepID=A0A4Z2GTA6_9TELE|nr:hypothetical protein EYF80_033739 [Liparis tanakae]
MGWISLVKTTGRLRCSSAMSRFRFSFQLYLGCTMIWLMATIFSVPRSNLEQRPRTRMSSAVKFLFQGGYRMQWAAVRGLKKVLRAGLRTERPSVPELRNSWARESSGTDGGGVTREVAVVHGQVPGHLHVAPGPLRVVVRVAALVPRQADLGDEVLVLAEALDLRRGPAQAAVTPQSDLQLAHVVQARVGQALARRGSGRRRGGRNKGLTFRDRRGQSRTGWDRSLWDLALTSGYLPHVGTVQASFWTVGSLVKHHGPSGRRSGFRQKFSCRALFGSEALNSLGHTGGRQAAVQQNQQQDGGWSQSRHLHGLPNRITLEPQDLRTRTSGPQNQNLRTTEPEPQDHRTLGPEQSPLQCVCCESLRGC